MGTTEAAFLLETELFRHVDAISGVVPYIGLGSLFLLVQEHLLCEKGLVLLSEEAGT